MRKLLEKNYAEIKIIIFEELLLQTHNYKTARAAHQHLEQIIKKESEKALKIHYGLQMQPGTVLRFAKREKYKWLLQPELKAIKEGLIFVEWKHEKENVKYRGYLNAQGQKHGVGFIIAVQK